MYTVAGVLNGPFEMYNEAGKLESKGAYLNGKPNGKWEYYYPHGSMLRQCTYNAGKLEGKSLMYGENGKLTEECGYKNNKRHGVRTTYDPKTGNVVLKEKYENGSMVKLLEGSPGGAPLPPAGGKKR